MSRTYLYGIVASGGTPALACAGVACAGVDGASPVQVVAHQGLDCVVSDYRGEEFAAMPKERLVRSLLAHQQVVERVMQGGSVLPVKFGTLLASRQEVRTALAQGHTELAGALASVQGRSS
ncbi:MAG: hypothetical protein EXR60_05605 [Dehalococcoidia bacterium]|nr:hypothetical protein [Dehalococcoidia bacterium]